MCGKTEKCCRRHFHFANFAKPSGHVIADELQRELEGSGARLTDSTGELAQSSGQRFPEMAAMLLFRK